MRGDRTNYGRGSVMTRIELRLAKAEIKALHGMRRVSETLQDTIRRIIREQFSKQGAEMTFCNWLEKELGTRKWVVAKRWTDRLRRDYDCRVHPDRFRTLQSEYEKEHGPIARRV
jgi:hypothetical protein